mgnify:FL=1
MPKTLSESGYYYTKDDIALYLVTFKKLPDNYVTKDAIGLALAKAKELEEIILVIIPMILQQLMSS